MPESLKLPDLPLMLAGIPRPVEELLGEAGIAAEILPEVPLFAAGTGRFVLFDSRNAHSAAQARRAAKHGLTSLDVHEFLPATADPARLSREPATQQRERQGTDAAGVFLEQLKTAIEQLGGAWVRIADYPFPFQSAISIGIQHVSAELADIAGIAAILPRQATHFVSTRLRADRLAYLASAGQMDLGWQIDPDEQGDSARRLVSHWTTRRKRFAEAGLSPAGVAVQGDWENAPSPRQLLELGLKYSCHQTAGIACRAVSRSRGAPEAAWIKFSTLALPPQDRFLEWVGEHYQSGCPLFLTTTSDRLDLVQELLRLAGDAQRCSLMWQTSFGEFARWWALRRKLKLSVWRTETGHEIHATGDFSQFAWGVEIWRGQHRATLPLRTTELSVSDNGLVYAESLKRTPAGCTTPGDHLRNLVAHPEQPSLRDPFFTMTRFRKKGSPE